MNAPTPLPIYSSQTILNFQTLATLPKHKLDHDWHGDPPLAPSYFVLALDPSNLWFAAECKQTPNFDRKFAQNDFAEGLWQRDVAELFLVEDQTSRYQEFNLSPSGAWWSGVFKSYRQADQTFDHKHSPTITSIITCANIMDNSWSSAMRIPLTSLAITITFGPQSKANVSMIIGGQLRQHLSWSKIASKQPDFHRCQEFSCLQSIAPTA